MAIERYKPTRNIRTRVSPIRANTSAYQYSARNLRNLSGDLGEIGDYFYERAKETRIAEAEEAAYNYTFQRGALSHDLKTQANGGTPGLETVRDENAAILPALPARDSVSIFDRTYRAAILSRYATDSQFTARRTLGDLARQYEDDPEKFATAADSYRKSFLANSPLEIKKHVGPDMRNVTMSMFNKLSSAKAAKEKALARDALKAQFDISQVEAIRLAGNGNYLDYMPDGQVRLNPELASAWTRQMRSLVAMQEQGMFSGETLKARIYESGINIGTAMLLQSLKEQGTKKGSHDLRALAQRIETSGTRVPFVLPTFDPETGKSSVQRTTIAGALPIIATPTVGMTRSKVAAMVRGMAGAKATVEAAGRAAQARAERRAMDKAGAALTKNIIDGTHTKSVKEYSDSITKEGVEPAVYLGLIDRYASVTGRMSALKQREFQANLDAARVSSQEARWASQPEMFAKLLTMGVIGEEMVQQAWDGSSPDNIRVKAFNLLAKDAEQFLKLDAEANDVVAEFGNQTRIAERNATVMPSTKQIEMNTKMEGMALGGGAALPDGFWTSDEGFGQGLNYLRSYDVPVMTPSLRTDMLAALHAYNAEDPNSIEPFKKAMTYFRYFSGREDVANLIPSNKYLGEAGYNAFRSAQNLLDTNGNALLDSRIGGAIDHFFDPDSPARNWDAMGQSDRLDLTNDVRDVIKNEAPGITEWGVPVDFARLVAEQAANMAAPGSDMDTVIKQSMRQVLGSSKTWGITTISTSPSGMHLNQKSLLRSVVTPGNQIQGHLAKHAPEAVYRDYGPAPIVRHRISEFIQTEVLPKVLPDFAKLFPAGQKISLELNKNMWLRAVPDFELNDSPQYILVAKVLEGAETAVRINNKLPEGGGPAIPGDAVFIGDGLTAYLKAQAELDKAGKIQYAQDLYFYESPFDPETDKFAEKYKERETARKAKHDELIRWKGEEKTQQLDLLEGNRSRRLKELHPKNLTRSDTFFDE